jgi:hypothetical protein
MKKFPILILVLITCGILGCQVAPVQKISSDSSNICGDCVKDNFKNYVPCYVSQNGKRVCDLCDAQCCDFPDNGGTDRCCCLHQRDDCFKVCVAKKLARNLPVPEKYMIKYRAWKKTQE